MFLPCTYNGVQAAGRELLQFPGTGTCKFAIIIQEISLPLAVIRCKGNLSVF